MGAKRAVVTLEFEHVVEVEQICLDDDAEAALEFVKKCIKPQLDAQQYAGCDPQLHLRGSVGQTEGGKPERERRT